MKKIVLAGACRTAIGKFQGQFKDVPARELAITTWAALSRLVWARMSPVRLP